jgi:tetratricopeptide (TPR) repeat protein
MRNRRFKTAQSVQPADRTVRFLLGFVFYLKKRFRSRTLRTILADPNDARVILYRGLTEEALNHPEAAVANYERAIQLDKSSAESRVAYARLLFAQGNPDRAEVLIDQALKLAPKSADALYEKGRCLFERAASSLPQRSRASARWRRRNPQCWNGASAICWFALIQKPVIASWLRSIRPLSRGCRILW